MGDMPQRLLKFLQVRVSLALLAGCFTLACGGLISPEWAAASATVDFLYQLAQEYRKAGLVDEAIHELHKALLLEPNDPKVSAALAELESLQAARRQQEMERTMAQLERGRGGGAGGQPVLPSTVSSPRASSGRARRVPDPRLNGVKWFYVFGRDGNPDYGALAQVQQMLVDVPRSAEGPVTITVLDADTRGRHDEMAGDWNTSTAFRVLSGSTLLDSRTVSPEAKDGTAVQFGPFPIEVGEVSGDRSRFRVEAEGLEGDDNNLYAFEVRPASAECAVPLAAIRLAVERGARMRFYPFVPEGTTCITERNYDLDPEGGWVTLRPAGGTGRGARSIPMAPSGSAAWSATEIEVPDGADGARWTYQVTKATQHKGNMAFRLSDQRDEPLSIYLSPGGEIARPPMTREKPAPAAVERTDCTTFAFDSSASYDADRGPLRSYWTFGDGASAEGVRVRHTYAYAGNYEVELKVVDDSATACCEAQATQLLRVNTPPQAAVDAPSDACVGAAVSLSASRSSDTAGEPLSYSWDFGDGSTGEGRDVTHAYSRGGTYTARLLVDDNQATPCSQSAATVSVRVNSPPVAQMTIQGVDHPGDPTPRR